MTPSLNAVSIPIESHFAVVAKASRWVLWLPSLSHHIVSFTVSSPRAGSGTAYEGGTNSKGDLNDWYFSRYSLE